MATTTKITISVPTELVKKARRAVRLHRAGSVSDYFAEGARRREQEDDLQKLLDEMLAETGGPLTDNELNHARALRGKPPLKKRRTRT